MFFSMFKSSFLKSYVSFYLHFYFKMSSNDCDFIFHVVCVSIQLRLILVGEKQDCNTNDPKTQGQHIHDQKKKFQNIANDHKCEKYLLLDILIVNQQFLRHTGVTFYYKSIVEIEKLVLGHVTPMTFAMVISLKNNVLNTKHCNFSWIYYAINLYQHMIKNQIEISNPFDFIDLGQRCPHFRGTTHIR